MLHIDRRQLILRDRRFPFTQMRPISPTMSLNMRSRRRPQSKIIAAVPIEQIVPAFLAPLRVVADLIRPKTRLIQPTPRVMEHLQLDFLIHGANRSQSLTSEQSRICRNPAISRRMSPIGSSDGVPPPKKTVFGPILGGRCVQLRASIKRRSTNRAIRSADCRVML